MVLNRRKRGETGGWLTAAREVGKLGCLREGYFRHWKNKVIVMSYMCSSEKNDVNLLSIFSPQYYIGNYLYVFINM